MIGFQRQAKRMNRASLNHVMWGLGQAWLIIWVLLIPLIHIHPEGDHAHGSSHHVHAGVVHTVFSQDLECEFRKTKRSPSDRAPGERWGMLKETLPPVHAFTHTEIGFALLHPSEDDPVGKGFSHHGLVSFPPSSSHLALGCLRFQLFDRPPQGDPAQAPYRSRPPPTDFI